MAVQIQLRNDTAANWQSANPTLLPGEMGIELDTSLYKIGDGVTAWNDLEYGILGLTEVSNYIDMTDTAEPVKPDSGILRLYTRNVASRQLLTMKGPSGLATPLQPSIFQNQVVIVAPSVTTSLTVIGTSLTSAGTISHPVATEVAGYMANFATAGTAAAVAGTGDNAVRWFRGSATGANGFFFYTRVYFPDSSYDYTTGTTGSRFYAGLTSNTLILMAQSNNHASARAAFVRINDGTLNDENWFFTCRPVTGTETRIDTGMPFSAQKIYDMYIFCPPQSATIYYKIDNITDNTSSEGSTQENLPDGNVAMRAGIQLCTINAISRNVRMQRIYVESDL